MAEDDVELARRGHEAAMRGDLDAVREFLDPEVSWHGGDPSASDTCHGRDQALEFIRRGACSRGHRRTGGRHPRRRG